MATAALAQEKIWFDKPAYDKAEQLYYERLAKSGICFKGMSHKSTEPFSSILVDVTSLGKSKPKKSKDNKCLLDNETKENFKHFKLPKNKNSKNDNQNVQQENVMEKEKHIIEAGKKEINLSNDNNDKFEAKDVKEKTNKADKKYRNKDEKCELKEKKEQLPQQGNHHSTCSILPAGGSLADEVAKARQHIKESLQCMDDIAVLTDGATSQDASRIAKLEKENKDLKAAVQELKNVVISMEGRFTELEGRLANLSFPNLAICPPKPQSQPQNPANDDDDDVDLFGSESEGEDAEAAKIREQRLAAYAAKKSKKPALIAKSNIILDVKPWDDTTDMKEMEKEVRKIECDGLLWGTAKLVPLAYGIHKLQISCVVEDDKVSIDWLTEQIQEREDYVQSVDIAAFNKV